MPALVDKFKGKKRPPKFADEGPPDMAETPRGSGAGVGDEPDMSDMGDKADMSDVGGDANDGSGDMPDAGGDPNQAQDPEEQALDDLADVIGVGPQDREDFGNALEAYIQACIAKTLGGASDGPPGASDMMPPASGGDQGGESGGY
jgi:hypothetical protein